MQDGFVAEITQTSMAMNNLYLLANADVSKYRKEGEDGREGDLTIDDEKGDVVHFKAVGKVANALAVTVGMCDDDDFVSSIYEFAGELVDVRFDASWLREEEVADHGDVVRSTRHGQMLRMRFRFRCRISGKGFHSF